MCNKMYYVLAGGANHVHTHKSWIDVRAGNII